jgi:hypothetical protein
MSLLLGVSVQPYGPGECGSEGVPPSVGDSSELAPRLGGVEDGVYEVGQPRGAFPDAYGVAEVLPAVAIDADVPLLALFCHGT